MKKAKSTIIVYIVTLIILIITGVIWWQFDLVSIRNLDYQKESQHLSSFNDRKAGQLLVEIRNYVENRFMNIIDEGKVNNSKYEIVGYSQKTWLFSGFVHKITIVGKPHFVSDLDLKFKLVDVYVSHRHGGALPFLSIALFILLAISALVIKKENVKHIFDSSTDL